MVEVHVESLSSSIYLHDYPQYVQHIYIDRVQMWIPTSSPISGLLRCGMRSDPACSAREAVLFLYV